jgi:MFS transporter, YNFM family, putative membrane transport protein
VLGGFVGRTLCALLAARWGWQTGFVVLAVLNAVGGMIIWAWLPPDTHLRRHAKQGGAALLHHLRNPQLMATCAAGFCVLFCLLGIFTYVNFYLAAPPFNLGTGALGLLFVIYLVGAATTPSAGRAIDRFGHRATFPLALAVAIAGVLLTLIHSIPAVIAGLAVFSVGLFAAQSSASSYIGIAAKQNQAAAVGVYVTFYYLGGCFGSAVPGYIWSFGGWRTCVILIALVQLGTMGIALKFWSRPGAPGPGESTVPSAAAVAG